MSQSMAHQAAVEAAVPMPIACEKRTMSCRIGCGACCIAPSLSSPIPGMPGGKPAGVRCAQLTEENRCAIYVGDGRPAVCGAYQATEEFCGSSRDDALRLLTELERVTGDGLTC